MEVERAVDREAKIVIQLVYCLHLSGGSGGGGE